MKKIFSLLVFFLSVTLIAFGQDTTAVTGTGSTGGWISNNLTLVVTIIYGLYELVVRLVPTAKNWSILTYVMRLVQFLIPNKTDSKSSFNTHD